MTLSRTPSPNRSSRSEVCAFVENLIPSTSCAMEVTGVQNSTERSVFLHDEIPKCFRVPVIESHGNYEPLETKASLNNPIPSFTNNDFRAFVVRCVKNGMTGKQVQKVVKNRYSETLCDNAELRSWATSLSKDKIQHWTQAAGVRRGLSIKQEQAARLIEMKYSSKEVARVLNVSPITITRWVNKSKAVKEKQESSSADDCCSSKLAPKKPRYHNDDSGSTISSEFD